MTQRTGSTSDPGAGPGMPVLTDGQREALARVARQYDVDLIVLFGSYAKGTARPRSDMDIAVRAARPGLFRGDPEELVSWEMDLFDDLSEVLAPPEGLDMVVLNRADSTLMYEVAHHGTLLYEREFGAIHQFRSYAARRFDDDAKFRRWAWEYLKRRCLHGAGPVLDRP